MTFPTMMTREELLELAALDAFGLLDDYESDLYTRSFHHAPAAVQSELVALQAQLAADDRLLPQEDPPAALRERVLAVVARAIERQNSELAPLATIGRRRTDLVGAAPGRWFSGTSQLWRAAAFLLTGMVVVLAYISADAKRENQRIFEAALSIDTSRQVNELIGKTFDDFLFEASTRRFVLVDQNNPSSDFKAAVFYNEATREIFVVTDSLPRGEAEDYQLQIRSADGSFARVLQFASNGGLQGLRHTMDALAIAGPMQWRISGPHGILLASA